MRSRRVAALLACAAVLLLSAVASGGTRVAGCVTPAAAPDSWTVVATDDVTYPESYEAWLLHGHPHYALVVDPYQPCRVFRIGTPAAHFTDRNVVQRSLDGGRSWATVLRREAAFTALRLYVPAPGVVLLTEDGVGAGVLRSDDAGATWRAATGGIENEHAHSIGYAPGDARHLYVVTLPCRTLASASPACDNHNVNNGEDFVGLVALWRSADGGATWRRCAIPQETMARSVFKVLLRAGHPEQPFVYDAVNLGALHAQEGDVLTTSDGGATFSKTGSAPPTLFDQVGITAGPRGGALLYERDNITGGDRVSADGGTTAWADAGRYWKTERSALTALPSGRLVTLGAVGFGGSFEGNEMRAFFSDDAFRTLRSSRTVAPGLPPDYGYVVGEAQATANGDVYVSYAVHCVDAFTWQGPVDRCGGGSGEHRYVWRTVRYRPPARGADLAPTADPGGRPAACLPAGRCDLVPRAPCALAGAPAGAGVAFDGAALLYGGVDGGVLHRVDPRTCRNLGSVAIAFDGDDLRRAAVLTARTHTADPGMRPRGTPTLDPARVRIDAATYDAARDVLWFSLADVTGAVVAEGNPAAVFSVALHAARPTARLAFATGRCLPHRNLGAGMELLAWDPENDRIAACQQARPVVMTPDGVPDADAGPCALLAPFRGYGYGWPVTSWTDVDGGRALLLVDADTGTGASLVDYDLASCTVAGTYGAAAVGAAKASGGMAQLACDPVTFAPSVAVWHRAGATLTPYVVPGNDVSCDVPTTTTVVAGTRACARLTVTGPAAPVAGQRLAIAVDGAAPREARTGPDGVACAGDRPAAGREHVVAASFPGAAPYLGSAGWRSFVPFVVPPKRPPVPRVPPPPLPHVPAPPGQVPPAPPAPPAPGVAPAVPLVLPVPGAQAPVGGLSDEQEQQSQLATVAQDEQEHQPQAGEELLAASMLTAMAAGAAVWQRRTRVVRAR
ncbi:MAG: hypothetical protein QOE45_1361 [Frankiaceae bacterium]|jgi:hypothetical protein|nr:hypothetical protein [Frankiaceae bacterium]